MKRLSEFIEHASIHHIRAIQTEPLFPGVCNLSSHLLASYLNACPDLPSVRLVYGTYGYNGLFHAWIEADDTIIDFVLVDMLPEKESRKTYHRMDAETLMDRIYYRQGGVFPPEKGLLDGYKQIAYIQPEFTHLYREGDSYLDFVYRVTEESVEWRMHQWAQSAIEDDGRTFGEFLADNGLRVGKRFFTKYAILKETA